MRRIHRKCLRIAIVDDDISILSLLCEVFDHEGWAALPCPNGETAFAMLQFARPDLVVLDLRLDTPERGSEILRRLRLHPVMRETPVVICSAVGEQLVRSSNFLAENGTAIVSKPFDVDALVSIISSRLSASSLRQARHAQGAAPPSL